MLNDSQVNKLTEAMYLVSKMLGEAETYKKTIEVNSVIVDTYSGAKHRERKEGHKDFKKLQEGKIKSLPAKREYKDALSILRQHTDRPGVKKLLVDVYREYPELAPKGPGTGSVT